MMAGARDRWWVIGSAAVVLLGGETEVADVDVLLSTRDADAIDQQLGLELRGGASDGHFRSVRHGRVAGTIPPIELMADLAICGKDGWRALYPTSRVATGVGDAVLYHPDCAEMIAILGRFGRPKDRERAALLGGRERAWPPRA